MRIDTGVLGFRTAAVVLGLAATWCGLADWPQFRGPEHDGKSASPIRARWPASGLEPLWKVPTTGGFSVFAVVGDRAYTLMTREFEGARRESCVAIEAATGKELWAVPVGVAKYDGGGDSGADGNKGGDGPRATPTIHDGRVYVLNAQLKLICLKAESGETVWSKDLIADHGGRMIAWQNAASAILDGGLIYLCCGAEVGSLMALSAEDGSVVWKGESDKMTHVSPVPVTLGGVRQVIFFTQRGLVSADAKTGQVLWRHPFRYSVSTAASPVVFGDIVYCSAGYGVGSAAVRVSRQGGGFTVKELWRVADNKLANHWSTPVVKDGYLYGLFGFKEYGVCPFKCVELATGKEMWSKPGFGPGGVVMAGGMLVVLNDRGELVLIDPQPTAYKELGRSPAVSGKCWNHPTVSNGRIFARSTKEGACFDVSVKTAAADSGRGP